MIRRQFLKLFGQLSVIVFVLKGQTEERVSSDLTPTVDPEAVIKFQQYNTLSSGPLGSAPLCAGPVPVRISHE